MSILTNVFILKSRIRQVQINTFSIVCLPAFRIGGIWLSTCGKSTPKFAKCTFMFKLYLIVNFKILFKCAQLLKNINCLCEKSRNKNCRLKIYPSHFFKYVPLYYLAHHKLYPDSSWSYKDLISFVIFNTGTNFNHVVCNT